MVGSCASVFLLPICVPSDFYSSQTISLITQFGGHDLITSVAHPSIKQVWAKQNWCNALNTTPEGIC